MRTTSFSSLLVAAAGMAILAGCTVKDVDAPARAEAEVFVEAIVRRLEDGEDTALELARAAAAGAVVDVHVLAEHEVGGVPDLEAPVGAALRRGRLGREREEERRDPTHPRAHCARRLSR